ncbi:hypothetical protein M8J76_005319 [Diaphorina citri]|nr:hypothetical protein M8J75_011646 [Diaphorina citri]KAI5740593.1 hypothetical protein M8J76_005319 [Diaphorina citri]
MESVNKTLETALDDHSGKVRTKPFSEPLDSVLSKNHIEHKDVIAGVIQSNETSVSSRKISNPSSNPFSNKTISALFGYFQDFVHHLTKDNDIKTDRMTGLKRMLLNIYDAQFESRNENRALKNPDNRQGKASAVLSTVYILGIITAIIKLFFFLISKSSTIGIILFISTILQMMKKSKPHSHRQRPHQHRHPGYRRLQFHPGNCPYKHPQLCERYEQFLEDHPGKSAEKIEYVYLQHGDSYSKPDQVEGPMYTPADKDDLPFKPVSEMYDVYENNLNDISNENTSPYPISTQSTLGAPDEDPLFLYDSPISSSTHKFSSEYEMAPSDPPPFDDDVSSRRPYSSPSYISASYGLYSGGRYQRRKSGKQRTNYWSQYLKRRPRRPLYRRYWLI